MKGRFDDFRIYVGELTPLDVSAIYSETASPVAGTGELVVTEASSGASASLKCATDSEEATLPMKPVVSIACG